MLKVLFMIFGYLNNEIFFFVDEWFIYFVFVVVRSIIIVNWCYGKRSYGYSGGLCIV